MWFGLDSSIAAYGFAVMQTGDGVPSILEVGTWKTRNEEAAKRFADTARRVDYLADQLLALFQRHRPAVAFVESLAIPPATSRITISIMGRVRGITEGIAKASGVPLFEFTAQGVKKCATGSSSAEKSEVAGRMLQVYPTLRGQNLDDNATDAVAVAHKGAASEQLRWHVEQMALAS